MTGQKFGEAGRKLRGTDRIAGLPALASGGVPDVQRRRDARWPMGRITATGVITTTRNDDHLIARCPGEIT